MKTGQVPKPDKKDVDPAKQGSSFTGCVTLSHRGIGENVSLNMVNIDSQVLLPTVTTTLIDKDGTEHKATWLIDSIKILTEMMKRLQWPVQSTINLNVHSFGEKKTV